jgi:hypothetical protein
MVCMTYVQERDAAVPDDEARMPSAGGVPPPLQGGVRDTELHHPGQEVQRGQRRGLLQHRHSPVQRGECQQMYVNPFLFIRGLSWISSHLSSCILW